MACDPLRVARTYPAYGAYCVQCPAIRHEQEHMGLVVLLRALSAFPPMGINMYLPAFLQIKRDLAAPPGFQGPAAQS